MIKRGIAVALLLAAVAATSALAQDAPPSVQVAGPPEVVLEPSKFNCRGSEPRVPDSPDEPPRMFQDSTGTLRVFASNHLNFTFIARPDGAVFHPDCHQSLRSALNADPAAFADRQWITSPYTIDGRTVHAFVHDEYWGWIHDPSNCPPRSPGARVSCYFAAITRAKSEDGGVTFVPDGVVPDSLVAAIPYRFEPSMSRAGIGNPSNIVRNPADGYFYAFVQAFGYKAQKPGTCLIRSRDLVHWNFWDGTGFSGVFVDPYTSREAPEAHVCRPVTRARISSAVYHQPSGGFIGAMPRRPFEGGGIALVSSRDLIQWSAPAVVISQPSDAFVLYPTLMEPGFPDAGRNFDRIDARPYLYYIEIKKGAPRTRTVMRLPLLLGPIVRPD